jgi:hypothetical protein
MVGIAKIIKQYTDAAKLILRDGVQSEVDFVSSLTRLDNLTSELYNIVERRAPHLLTTDTTPLTVTAQVASDAIGTNTFAEASIDMALVQRDLYSVAAGRAISFAAFDPVGVAAAATFTDASGGELSVIGVRTVTGENFRASIEGLFAIDFLFLDLDEVELVRERNVFAENLTADVEEGNVATLELDLSAQGENTYISAAASVLSVEDTYSGVDAIADLLVA